MFCDDSLEFNFINYFGVLDIISNSLFYYGYTNICILVYYSIA